ncbi:hypothetical protein BJY00DRAFT_298522 [Aspergillus carlsbadensis]|nr:hypothetical protein BJY00DRAFT_298522 [Aspergillus carlsbadensis]
MEVQWSEAIRSLKVPDFKSIGAFKILEEERSALFKKGHYYLIKVGDVYTSKYHVIGKLGFGVISTVWLARDLEGHQYVTLKQLGQRKSWHAGSCHVRTALDTFIIPRSGGGHRCLAQKPMWDSFSELKYRLPILRFTEDLPKADIKGDNILQEIADKAILERFTKEELEYPSPRKFIDGAPVYASRQFDIWDLFEDRHLFYSKDPDGRGFTTRGPRFTGKWKQDIGVPRDTSLESSEEFLEGKNKDMFMEFMRGLL